MTTLGKHGYVIDHRLQRKPGTYRDKPCQETDRFAIEQTVRAGQYPGHVRVSIADPQAEQATVQVQTGIIPFPS